MKKALVLFLSILSLFFVTQVNAESYDIDSEVRTYQLSADTFSINGTTDYPYYVSTGYISLVMGLGNVLSFDITDQLAQFNYYDSDNLFALYTF